MSEALARSQFRISMIRRARLERAGQEHSVLILDIGLRGVFVEWTAEPLPLGERVSLSFRLPDNDRRIEAACRVAWWHAAHEVPVRLPAGAGLEFEDLDAADRALLEALLEEHTRRHPRARQFTRWWPDEAPRDARHK